jgi:hypothetical protein
LIVGGNPFSGVSHQGTERDWEMRDYYTGERIKATWRECEELGISACVARADNHIMRLRREYLNEGGKIVWLAQSAPEMASLESNIRSAQTFGAAAVFIHGGVVDKHFQAGTLDELRKPLALIRELGMAPGIAAHIPDTHRKAVEIKLDFDFHMLCFYNLVGRQGQLHAAYSKEDERFQEEDRQRAAKLLKELERPCLAYKILAAGRNDPEPSFRFAVEHMKPADAIVFGVFTKDRKDMIREDVRLAMEFMRAK